MAWIKVISEEDADQELLDAYSRAGSARGSLANILRIHSVHPKAMSAHIALYRELMFGRSELTRKQRETIAVAVSAANRCHY